MMNSCSRLSGACRAGRSPWESKGAKSVSWLLAMALAIGPQQGWAQQCTLSVEGVNFGSYDTFSNQSLDSAGNIGVSCDVSMPYTISLSPGSGSYASRAMYSGPHALNYNLYLDATRTTVWGDGTGGTATAGGSATSANHAVYGRIPARQNVYVGGYADTIVVTVQF